MINPQTSATTSPLTLLTNLHSPQNGLDDPTSTPEQPCVLPIILANFTLHDASASQEKSGVVIPITILFQNGHIPCSALIDTGSPVTLLSEKLHGQLSLPSLPLNLHFHLVGATGDSLTTLGTAQVDIVSDHKTWPTPAIVVSSLAYSLILGLNLLKLTKSKIDFEMSNVKIGSKAYPSDIHGIKSLNSTIIVPTSDVYRPCRLLLNKRASLMIVATLITLAAVSSHTHCHHFTIRLQAMKSKKTYQLFLLDWKFHSLGCENTPYNSPRYG